MSKERNSESPVTVAEEPAPPEDFIRAIIRADLESGKHSTVRTRFPPEPNGYLHIGHAKALCLDFGAAEEFGGECNLRFDDTNPLKEDVEYVDAIKEDVRWLGFDWGCREYYASDYFERLYQFAVQLIEDGKAYVDSLSAEEIRQYRGGWHDAGKPSPYRDRPIAESLDLFARMRAGEFDEGEHVLRAKIDMASGNMNLRDPTLYRIRKVTHHRTGDDWCVYPMYDWAHTLSDAIEGITHSLCSLEFEDHRPLYDWFLDNTDAPSRPRQIEFARLAITHTMLSKRKLRRLVDEGLVSGWDDPRMPTLSGLRRRGYPPAAIRDFANRVGLTKNQSMTDVAMLEASVREELNHHAPRRMAVLRPLRVVIENYPEGQVEQLEAVNNPEDAGRRHARDPVLARALHRARRLHGRPAQAVLPARAGPRGAAALRLLPHLPRGGQGRERRDRRAALHLRSGDARRQRARRAQGEGDHPLGVGAARRGGDGAALRPPVHRRGPGRRAATICCRCSIPTRSRPSRAR